MPNKPTLADLCFFARQINAAMANGHNGALTFDYVHAGIAARTLFQDLPALSPNAGFDFSLWQAGTKEESALLDALDQAGGALMPQDVARKTGVQTSGLGMLLAIVILAIDLKYWADPEQMATPTH